MPRLYHFAYHKDDAYVLARDEEEARKKVESYLIDSFQIYRFDPLELLETSEDLFYVSWEYGDD